MREIILTAREYDFYRVYVTSARIEIKGIIAAPHNFPWLIQALNTCIPLEMPTMRGCIWLGNDFLNLANSSRSILETLYLRDHFWRNK